MTESEKLEKYAALCKRLGKRPEWDDYGRMWRLVYKPDVLLKTATPHDWWKTDKGGPLMAITGHEALCLMERFWRVWLDERGVLIKPLLEITDGQYVNRWYVKLLKGLSMTEEFYDYNAAQIAAVEAVLGEEKKDE